MAPSVSAMMRAVAAASSSRDVKGICTATTGKSLDSSRGITLFQLDPSAQAPCTSTMVAADLAMVTSSAYSLGQNAKQLHPSAPQNPLRSAIGSLADHAVAWSWPWMSQLFAQLQLRAIFCKPCGLARCGSPQAA